MADAFLKQYGGSGADSSDCTAKKSQVLAGVTAITSDSNDEAEAGTMPERGALNRTLAAGQSVTLLEGHYTGGTVSAQSLAIQTGGATAEDRYVKKGLTYWKDGVLRTGTMETQSAISFSAAALSHNTIRINWRNPTKGPWEGIIIRMSTSGTPGVSGGIEKYRGAGNNPNQGGGNNYVDITGLSSLTTYYFSCVNYFAGLDNGNTANVNAKTTRRTVKEIIEGLHGNTLELAYMDYYSGNYYSCRITGNFSSASEFSFTGSRIKDENANITIYEGSSENWKYGTSIVFTSGATLSDARLSDSDIAELMTYSYKILASDGSTILDFGKITGVKYTTWGSSYKFGGYILGTSVGDYSIQKSMTGGKVVFY